MIDLFRKTCRLAPALLAGILMTAVSPAPVAANAEPRTQAGIDNSRRVLLEQVQAISAIQQRLLLLQGQILIAKNLSHEYQDDLPRGLEELREIHARTRRETADLEQALSRIAIDRTALQPSEQRILERNLAFARSLVTQLTDYMTFQEKMFVAAVDGDWAEVERLAREGLRHRIAFTRAQITQREFALELVPRNSWTEKIVLFGMAIDRADIAQIEQELGGSGHARRYREALTEAAAVLDDADALVQQPGSKSNGGINFRLPANLIAARRRSLDLRRQMLDVYHAYAALIWRPDGTPRGDEVDLQRFVELDNQLTELIQKLASNDQHVLSLTAQLALGTKRN